MLSPSTLTTNECTEDDIMLGWVLLTSSRNDPVEEDIKKMFELIGVAGRWSKHEDDTPVIMK